MKTVEGRQWARREDLIEHSGYSRATLGALWRDRRTNGHPAALEIDGVMHWDLQAWTSWFAEHCRRPRDTSKVDRGGAPDEQLPPAGQARVLGVDPSRITQYAKNPPPCWPAPARVEKLHTRTREYRTRAQLWAFADDPASGFGTTGGRPSGPATKPKNADPRVEVAAEALAAQPDRKAGELAAELAAHHGQSVDTWKRIITQARKTGRP